MQVARIGFLLLVVARPLPAFLLVLLFLRVDRGGESFGIMHTI